MKWRGKVEGRRGRTEKKILDSSLMEVIFKIEPFVMFFVTQWGKQKNLPNFSSSTSDTFSSFSFIDFVYFFFFFLYFICLCSSVFYFLFRFVYFEKLIYSPVNFLQTRVLIFLIMLIFKRLLKWSQFTKSSETRINWSLWLVLSDINWRKSGSKTSQGQR